MQAIGNSPFILSSTDATDFCFGMELDISACCPNLAKLWTKKYQKLPVFLLNSGFSAEKKFYWKQVLTVLQTEFLLA